MAEPVLYVLNRFGKLSETFIVTEMAALESRGERLLVDVLHGPEDGPQHVEVTRLRAAVRHLPRRPSLRDPAVALCHVRWAVRAPARWARLARQARAGGTWRQFMQAGLVADRVRRERARHVHTHFASRSAEVARDAAALAGVPFSVTVHAYDIFRADNAPKLVRRTSGAAAVVTVSQHNVEHLRAVLPQSSRVHLVPNGMPLPEAHGPSAQGPLLCVARLVAKKGIDVVLTAVAQLPEDLALDVVGAGPLEADLRALAHRLGIEDRVRFLGAQDSAAVDLAYRRACALVLAPRVAPDGDRDGLPTVFLEALARGLPVVSTDVVGIGEVVQHECTGLLVPPEDAPALAAALRRLRDDPALAARLGQAGRAWVARHHDPDVSAGLLVDVLTGGA